MKTRSNHGAIKRVHDQVSLLKVRTAFNKISPYITRSTTGLFRSMAELTVLFDKLRKRIVPRNKVTFCQILPVCFEGNTPIYRDVHRRRSHNTSSTCYSWFKLIVHCWFIEYFRWRVSRMITWTLPAIQNSWLLFSERFPEPDSSSLQVKSQKSGIIPVVKSTFFQFSRHKNLLVFFFFLERSPHFVYLNKCIMALYIHLPVRWDVSVWSQSNNRVISLKGFFWPCYLARVFQDLQSLVE